MKEKFEEISRALWVKASLHKKLKELAHKQERELKDLVLEMVTEYLNGYEK